LCGDGKSVLAKNCRVRSRPAKFAGHGKFLPSAHGKYFHFDEKAWRICWKNLGKAIWLRKSFESNCAQKKSGAFAPLSLDRFGNAS
jgi:hypothetical protein